MKHFIHKHHTMYEQIATCDLEHVKNYQWYFTSQHHIARCIIYFYFWYNGNEVSCTCRISLCRLQMIYKICFNERKREEFFIKVLIILHKRFNLKFPRWVKIYKCASILIECYLILWVFWSVLMSIIISMSKYNSIIILFIRVVIDCEWIHRVNKYI